MKYCSSLLAQLAIAVLAIAPHQAGAQSKLFNERLLDSGAPYDGFIVRFAPSTPEQRDKTAVRGRLQQVLAGLIATGEVSPSATTTLALSHRHRLAVGADVVIPSRRLVPREAHATMRRLAALPGVEYVELNVIHSTALTPNDPRYWDQWQYTNQTAGIRADRAWNLSTGVGVIVGVLDSGVASHTDLNSNIVPGWDFLSAAATANDGNGRDSNPADPGDWTTTTCANVVGPRDSSWHGTHVAGSIAAVGNNSLGVVGTAFSARVLPVRVLGVCGGPVSDIADGVVWASGGTSGDAPTLAPNAVPTVLNLSIGGESSCGPTYQAAIDFARSRGITVVVSAGNKNKNVSTSSPANCSGVIAVASVNVIGERADDSNFGPGVTLSAPGVDIRSTSNSGRTTPTTEAYLPMSGTSMAAPHVTGVVALVQSRRNVLSLPPMYPNDIQALLKQTADRIVGNCPNGCGAGILNAEAAVLSAAISAPRPFVAGTLSMPAGTVLNAVSIKIAYQSDGNLVVYAPDWTPLWASNTAGRYCTAPTCVGVFQNDGNLVLYQNGVPYWATNTQVPGGTLMFSSVEPYVYLYGQDGTLRYSSSALVAALGGTFTLRPPMSTHFAGGRLTYQSDGNLAIYDMAGYLLWSTNTSGQSCTPSTCLAAFQNDGNFVLYIDGYPYFATNTVGSRQMFLQATEPYLRILDNSNQVTWSSSNLGW